MDTHEPAHPGTDNVLSDWMTREQLAKQLRVSKDTLATWSTEGRGPVFIRVGTVTYYRRETVRRWLERLEAEKLNRGKR